MPDDEPTPEEAQFAAREMAAFLRGNGEPPVIARGEGGTISANGGPAIPIRSFEMHGALELAPDGPLLQAPEFRPIIFGDFQPAFTPPGAFQDRVQMRVELPPGTAYRAVRLLGEYATEEIRQRVQQMVDQQTQRLRARALGLSADDLHSMARLGFSERDEEFMAQQRATARAIAQVFGITPEELGTPPETTSAERDEARRLFAEQMELAYERTIHPERFPDAPAHPNCRATYGRSPVQRELARYRYRPTWRQRRARAMRALRAMPRNHIRWLIIGLAYNLLVNGTMILFHTGLGWVNVAVLLFCIVVYTTTLAWLLRCAYRNEGRID